MNSNASRHYEIFIIPLLAIGISACGGGGGASDDPEVLAEQVQRTGNACIASRLLAVPDDSIKNLVSYYVRHTNRCDVDMYTQYCFEYSGADLNLLDLADREHTCSYPGANGVMIRPVTQYPYGLAATGITVSRNNFSDSYVLSLDQTDTGAVATAQRNVLRSPKHIVGVHEDYNCTGTFRAGEGYVLEDCRERSSP